MKSFIVFVVFALAVVAMTEGRPQEIEEPSSQKLEAPKGVEAPKEDLKGAEAAYLAYSYAAYPYAAYSAYPYVVPAPAVLLRR